MSELHKLASSVAFIKKALHNNFTPTFTKIKVPFLYTDTELFFYTDTESNAEKDIIGGHINKLYNAIRLLRLNYCELKEILVKFQLIVDIIFRSILLKSIEKSLHKERFESFKTKKNKKKIC